PMARTNPHQIAWTAAGLRRAAAEVGVTLPVAYSQAVAADGLRREPNLGVTSLGDGVVLHTSPADNRHLPIVLGYADARGQWYRDGHRHTDQPEASIPALGAEEVAL
ncbi:MAG: hypothetical protein ACRD0J_15725, partial [Acidimicrobiales bacterium]